MVGSSVMTTVRCYQLQLGLCMRKSGRLQQPANQRSQLQRECRRRWRDKPPRLSTGPTGADIKISSSGADDYESNYVEQFSAAVPTVGRYSKPALDEIHAALHPRTRIA